jgi:hypothetical protein
VVGVLLLAGILMGIVAAVRRRAGWEVALLPALWLVLPFGALLAQTSSIYLHYLVALFPAIFLVMALPIGWLLGRSRMLAAAGTLLVAVVLVYQLAVTAVVYRVMEAYETTDPPAGPPALRQAAVGIPREAADLLGTGERYGIEPPIRYWQAIADRTLAEAATARSGAVTDTEAQVWVLAGETNPLTAEVPAIMEYLLRPRVQPRFLPPETLIFRMLQPSIVVELPGVDPIESLDRFGERRAVVPSPSAGNREGLARARITYVPDRGPQGWQSLAPSRVTARFEGAIQALGYRADERQVKAGGSLPVTTLWWVTSQGISGATVSLRLVDANGGVIRSETPERALPAPGEGDWVIVQRDELAVPDRTPAGQYSLEAALIDETTGRPLARSDQPGASVQLTTVRVTGR